jgi:excisionase family DNA binding protein
MWSTIAMSISTDPSNKPKQLVTSPTGACYMLNCEKDYLYGLLNSGEIESYMDGRSRKVVIASIERHIARRLKASKQFQRARYPVRTASA